MHHFSALKLLVALVVFVVCIYPYVRIVRRTGHSGW
ncbi:putative membrane protein [Burkholderia sp. MSHR3999]|nr:putative membrane protein [Burkholderia sp. MSHR3999]